ncbi:hypothetical protein AAGW18_14530 [Vreelandella titanicae]|uniref:Uncharacterized protein n=1 Tax=Vreelandella titanicae TaxID=664683 RepID=A0AAP9NL17_9GAMM|nr:MULTISPECIES: hypothetical protein [Halomonas]QKS23917.1 hypothetical protein FX987_01684 [Halomonas titanicae]UEQ02271.1 hypothetical protein LMS44_13290 [Halomonas profundus]CDG54840.1 conserved hypothetical protein [Halomonas sp. A3H3]SDJ42267.1 hypothetical protein SAMN04487867_14320 [Halomonas titanicae]
MSIDPMAVWANMTLKIWPERYWMLDLSDTSAQDVANVFVASDARYSCLIRDQAGVSAIVDEAAVERLKTEVSIRDSFGPFQVISTDGELPFDVIGFLGPVLRVLNEHGIKAGPQCGAVFDHLFIYERDIERANALLEDFISQARACQ